MVKIELLAKRNSDGSFSTTMAARDLLKYAFVDFYDEVSGEGYQRKETQREARGRQIEAYIGGCVKKDIAPSLFEMTANARLKEPDRGEWVELDENHELGFLNFMLSSDEKFLSLIDGGTRFLGIEKALEKGLIEPEDKFDVRVFKDLSKVEEIAYFLLINDRQKKVRTDLGLRVVQRARDEGELSRKDDDFLNSVVPDKEDWKYDASYIVAELNKDTSSKWYDRIQMPGQGKKRIALQAFFTSLKPLLTNKDLKGHLDRTRDDNKDERREFLIAILNNFWDAVSQLNPRAYKEPETSVLWSPIGVNSHHIALSELLVSSLGMKKGGFTPDRFKKLLSKSRTVQYYYWFTKSGSSKPKYPAKKGEATKMTGFANYGRVAKELINAWQRNLFTEDQASVEYDL